MYFLLCMNYYFGAGSGYMRHALVTGLDYRLHPILAIALMWPHDLLAASRILVLCAVSVPAHPTIFVLAVLDWITGRIPALIPALVPVLIPGCNPVDVPIHKWVRCLRLSRQKVLVRGTRMRKPKQHVCLICVATRRFEVLYPCQRKHPCLPSYQLKSGVSFQRVLQPAALRFWNPAGVRTLLVS